MERLTHQQLIQRLCERFQGTLDPTGEVDVRFPGGVIVVAATPEEIPAAVQRVKPLLGYRFLGVYPADLFIASRATGQTKNGLLDGNGATPKAPHVKLPGRWVRALTLRQQPGNRTSFPP